MEGIYQHYIIDMSSNNNFVQVPTMQGDGNGIRGFEVELIQNNVQYVIDPDNVIVSIGGTKSDTKGILNECTISEEGYILVDITSQMAAVPGVGEYQIVFMDRSTNAQLKSFPFHIITTKSAMDIDYVVSSDEFQLLEKKIFEAEKAEGIAKESMNRVLSLENTITTSESKRINAENARVTAETNRVSAEISRASAENTRISNEEQRKTNETNRVNAENIRISNENDRKANEQTRQDSESDRVGSEAERQINEEQREENENSRQLSETNRNNAEQNREALESERNSNEVARENAEVIRISNEEQRKVNETNRESIFNSTINDANAEILRAHTAANTATTKANEANSSATIANTKATEASKSADAAKVSEQNAKQSEEKAKTYMENASAVTGINIATDGVAGIVKGGENHIEDDGTLQLTKQTTDTTLLNSYAGGIKINEIIGKSEQWSTTGKNLLDCSGLTEQTAYGVTFTPIYENGLLQYINVNGTNSSEAVARYTIANKTIGLSLEDETVLIANGCPSGGSISSFFFLVHNNLKGGVKDIGNGASFKYYNEDSYWLAIDIMPGVTMNNTKFYPMIRLATIEDSTYEPYTGGIPSPNPDYPQEIKSVEVGEIKSVGKNLWNFGDITSISKSEIEWFLFLHAGTYTFSCDIENPNLALRVFTSSDLSDTNSKLIYMTQRETTFTVENDVYGFNYSNPSLNKISKIQVEEGSEATPYEPYTESKITLSSPVTLRGIGDAKDRIVRKDGVWGVERWIGNADLSDFYFTLSAPNRFYSDGIKGKILVQNANEKPYILSDSYNTDIWSIVYGQTKNFVIGGTDSGINVGYISIVDNRFTDATDFKNAVKGNIIYYALATPTFEPLPTADQIALNSLLSFDTVTYISTDSEIAPVIDLEYGTSRVGGYTFETWNMAKSNKFIGGDIISDTEPEPQGAGTFWMKKYK